MLHLWWGCAFNMISWDLGVYGKILFWLIAIGAFCYETRQIIFGKSSNNWRSRSARVVDVIVETRVDEGRRQSRPKINYEYRYNRKRYTGNKVKYGDLWCSNYGKSLDLLDGIVQGSEITIYVNPKRPSQAVLHRGYEGSAFWLVVFLGVFFLVH